MPITPVALEKMVGNLVAPNIEQSWGGVSSDTRTSTYIDQLGKKLLVHSPRKDIEHKFTLLESKDIPNACALGNGNVYITRAMLELLDNEAQLCAIIGHELGHIDRRHLAKQMDVTVGSIAIVGAVDSILNRVRSRLQGLGQEEEAAPETAPAPPAPAPAPATPAAYKMSPVEQKAYDVLSTIYSGIKQAKARASFLGQEPAPAPAPAPTPAEEKAVKSGRELAVDFIVEGYSRQNELEADASGLQYTAQAGYNPYAIVECMRKFQALEGEVPPLEVYFRSHPLAKDRIEALEKRIRDDYGLEAKGDLGYESYQSIVHPGRDVTTSLTSFSTPSWWSIGMVGAGVVGLALAGIGLVKGPWWESRK